MDNIPFSLLMAWVRDVGLPAIILVIWYYDHKKISDLENLSKAFKRLAEESKEVTKQTQEIAKTGQECLSMSVAVMSRLEQKISDNIFCPLVRKEIGK